MLEEVVDAVFFFPKGSGILVEGYQKIPYPQNWKYRHIEHVGYYKTCDA
jgi:hypothetical protein